MAKLSESVLVEASLAEAWDHYFDARCWAEWVDGFHAVVDPGSYPEQGGTLRWRSIPAGRGEVTERVLEHETRRLHAVAFEDPAMAGELRTRFKIEGEGTRVDQELTYGLSGRGPLTYLAGVFFVRGQVRASQQRTLLAFKHSCEEAADAGVTEPR